MNTAITTAPIPLSGLEAALNQANLACVLKHADLDNTSTSGTPTQTLELFDVEDGDVVTFRGMRVLEAFADASDAAFNSTTIAVGDGNNTQAFLTTKQLNVNGTEVLLSAGGGDTVTLVHPLTSLATGLSTNAIDLLTGFTPGFDGEIIGLEFVTTVAGTGSGASQVFNLEIGSTNLTGGVLTLDLASQATIGTVTAATAITANNSFTATDTISLEMAASGTVFTAGAGYFVIKMRRKDAARKARAYTAADTVDVLVTSTAGKALDDLDAGSLVLFFDVQKLDKLAVAAAAAG